MKAILYTRALHWSKQPLSMICWLLLPIIATCTFVSVANQWQNDMQIPVGLVIEDDSIMAENLSQSIGNVPLLAVKKMNKDEALVQLEQHQLDSVFVIKDGYQESIQNNSRNQVITAYVSDMSLAYTPVKEAITSYVQQDAGNAKAAHTVDQLVRQFGGEKSWGWEEIIVRSNEIREEEALLHSTFTFYNQIEPKQEESGISLWNVWGIWAFFAFLTTFFIYDWVIKEQQSSIKVRLSLLKISFRSYMLRNAFVYLVLLGLFDLINILVLSMYFDQSINLAKIVTIISFRLTISIAAFLFALYFRTAFFYYISSILATIFFSVIGGAFIPIDGLTDRWPWLIYASPIHAFLKGQVITAWLIVLLIILFIWYWRKEKVNAYSK
ncbi:ABC transporter permease [Paraliobacillus sediminis]|uniref:ABC transporter permease n=1 Tax=Paraliobacillus sediminis TaxID=1885916 RepID=UPI0013C35FCF|nr:ABC transporter permease [Paraliobacillus sediminis]